MFTRIGKLLKVRVLITTMALVMMIFSLTATAATPTHSTVNAGTETVITYYTDATHTTWSGMRRTLCSGYWTQLGTPTAYYTVEHPPCDCELDLC